MAVNVRKIGSHVAEESWFRIYIKVLKWNREVYGGCEYALLGLEQFQNDRMKFSYVLRGKQSRLKNLGQRTYANYLKKAPAGPVVFRHPNLTS